MKHNWPEQNRQSCLPAHSFAIIALLALLLFAAVYTVAMQYEQTTGDDLYYATVYPGCTLCWYGWLAQQANQKQEP